MAAPLWDTQVSLRFAVGAERDGVRTRQSATWIMRVTRGLDLYVLCPELGGDLAHVSVHADGNCHLKVTKAAGAKPEAVVQWELPDPISGTTVYHFLDVIFPATGLTPPANAKPLGTGDVLLRAPEPGQQLVVSILCELGPVEMS